jgi:hypothetical protein
MLLLGPLKNQMHRESCWKSPFQIGTNANLRFQSMEIIGNRRCLPMKHWRCPVIIHR